MVSCVEGVDFCVFGFLSLKIFAKTENSNFDFAQPVNAVKNP